MIIRGLVRGLYSVFYVSILVLLMLYIFGIIAMIVFRANDPFAFPNLGATMVNLFRAATLEDWTDIMYTSWYGCKNYPMAPNSTQAVALGWICTETMGSGPGVFLYWVIFIFVVGLVMLSVRARMDSIAPHVPCRRPHAPCALALSRV